MQQLSEETKHVCLFPGRLNLGGVGKNTLNLAEELVNQGHRVDLFLTALAGEYKALIPDGVNLYYGKGSAIKSFWALRRYLKSESPDILVTARDYLNLVGYGACSFLPSKVFHVATLRTTLTADRKTRSGFKYGVTQLLARFCYRYMDSVIAVSGAVADDYRSVFKIPALGVIYNPIITNRFDSLLIGDVSPEFNSPTKKVLAVGRLSPEKGFDVLINAFAKVAQDNRSELWILGEGPERKNLEALVSSLHLTGVVHMPGYVANPISYMGRSDVFVVPSRWEGLPTAMVEALAAGMSIVATRCPGGSAEILGDGKYGELVDVDDCSGMGKAIAMLLDEPKASGQTVTRGRSFSATTTVQQYLALLDR